MSFHELGPARDNKGAIPDDLNSIDPIEIELRARTAAIALKEIVPFLEQIHHTSSDKLDAVYISDWKDDAALVDHMAETLSELADEAQQLDAESCISNNSTKSG